MHLQQGTILAINNNQKDNPLCLNPIVQVFNTEKLNSISSDNYRIKANISDSQYYIKAIFSTKFSGHFESGNLKNNSLIKISSYEVRRRDVNFFVYVTDIEDFWDQDSLIGNPVNVASVVDKTKTPTVEKENKVEEKKLSYKMELKRMGFDKKSLMKQKQEAEMENNSNSSNKRNVIDTDEIVKRIKTDHTPIASLNPFLNKWVVKGRCTQKSDIRTFTNQKGEGKIFSVYVADESGNIKISTFSECVDIFYPLFEVGKVFTISKGTLKMANKKYSTGSTDYEIFLDKNSEVLLNFDETAPKFFFKFIKINQIGLANENVDVIGVAKEIYDVQTITLKNTGKEQKKRDILLVDESGNIKITLWGTKTDISVEQGDIVAVSGVSVKEYGGLSLSSISSTQVHINPDLEECFELKGWYENDGKNIKIIRNITEERKLLSEIKDHEIKWSTFIATIIYVKEENMFYNACIECNKKVILEDSNIYRCEKCNKTFENCKAKYITKIQVADFTSQVWASIFDEQGTSLFGVTADKLRQETSESDEIQSIVKNIYYKDYVFKAVMKTENYNNEEKKSYSIVAVNEVDFVKEGKNMLKTITASYI